MKYLLVVLLFASCGNKKVEIVERQKELKLTIQSAEVLQKDALRKMDYDKIDSLSKVKINARFEYDSLEVELKKY